MADAFLIQNVTPRQNLTAAANRLRGVAWGPILPTRRIHLEKFGQQLPRAPAGEYCSISRVPARQVEVSGSPRVLLADHHLVFLEALKALLEVRGLEVIGHATNGADAVRLADKLRPDVAVLGLTVPGLNGVDAAREIVDAAPHIGVVLLSDLTGEQLVRDALKVGVRGFVVKTQGVDSLIHTICEVARGGMCVSPGPARAIVGACLNGTRRPDSLSPREWEVLRLVAEGKTTKEAAALLCVSARTIDAHRANIMRTLGIHGIPGLVRYAIRQGLIEP